MVLAAGVSVVLALTSGGELAVVRVRGPAGRLPRREAYSGSGYVIVNELGAALNGRSCA